MGSIISTIALGVGGVVAIFACAIAVVFFLETEFGKLVGAVLGMAAIIAALIAGAGAGFFMIGLIFKVLFA